MSVPSALDVAALAEHAGMNPDEWRAIATLTPVGEPQEPLTPTEWAEAMVSTVCEETA